MRSSNVRRFRFSSNIRKREKPKRDVAATIFPNQWGNDSFSNWQNIGRSLPSRSDDIVPIKSAEFETVFFLLTQGENLCHLWGVQINTRIFSRCALLRTPDVSTRLDQRFADLFVCFKSHFIIGHVFVECSFDTISSFLFASFMVYWRHLLFTGASDWNQVKFLCNSDLVWTVWPSGRSDPEHRLWAQILHRCQ